MSQRARALFTGIIRQCGWSLAPRSCGGCQKRGPGALTRAKVHEPLPGRPGADAGCRGAEEAGCRVSKTRATNRRVTLSRDRIITRKRNKLTIIAVAGALSMATAASAAAAACRSGPSAGTAFARLTGPSSAAAAKQPSTQQNYLSVQHARAIADHRAVMLLLAQQAAARKAAA